MEIIDRLNRQIEHQQASDREVARLTGLTIDEYDADTMAPDPEEEWAAKED